MAGEIVMSREDLRDLPEYSCSIPTGTTIGKRWRKNIHFGSGRIPEWKIAEYVDDPNPEFIGIKWDWALDEKHNVHRGTLK